MQIVDRPSLQKWPQLIAATFITIAVDQGSKQLITRLAPAQIQFNSGISFGWFAINQVLLSIILVTIVVAVLAIGSRSRWIVQPYLAGVFLGGVLSNLLDRLIWGGVRDWLPIPVVNLRNNLADWSIVIVLSILVGRELGLTNTLSGRNK